MLILPRRDRVVQRFLEGNEVVKRPAAFIVISPDGCFGKIQMAMTSRIVAFAEQSSVLFVGKCRDVQAMRRAETNLHPEKNGLVVPAFSEKICAFVQPHSMNRE